MRFISTLRISLLIIITASLFSCKDKKEEFASEKLSEYIPLQPGKYITYRLDSLVYTNFGTVAVTRRYQVKHVVDAQITDNEGRPSYRVYTYITDSAGIQPWTASGSYFITPLTSQTEVIDDNMRVVKLHLPIKEGYQWPGNTYLSDDPYYPSYDFNNDNDIKSWDFTYDVFEPATSYRGHNYTDVFTVIQQDDHANAPVTDINSYGFNTQSVEKYSKNIGLVYRKYELWDYQTNPTVHYTGFGITMWMIDHN
jgi:hypothetical protein